MVVSRYAFDAFVVDGARRQLLRDGMPVALSPRALDALLLLLERAGEQVDKGELMQALWPHRVVEENNLNQAISSLRRALGETPGQPRYILTVPGRGYRFVGPRPVSEAEPPRPLRAVAVLPLRCLGQADDALSIGMADTLITRLGSLGALNVRPLAAVRRFLGQEVEPLHAGRVLAVDAVLEGTVQALSGGLRANLRLHETAGGAPPWTAAVDAPAGDVFALQDAVAGKVASALALRLDYEQKLRLVRRHTGDLDAWRAHALARHALEQRSPTGLQQAVEHFNEALARDPDYALAWVGLSDAYTIQGVFGARPPTEVGPPARAAALRALQLDAGLAEAHVVLGHARIQYERDWQGAEQAYRRALELDPLCVIAHHRYAILLMTSGRTEASFEQIRRARELDPVSPPIAVTEGFLQHWAGEDARAQATLLAVLERDPHFWMAHAWLAQVQSACGEPAMALASARQAHALMGCPPASGLLAWALAQASESAAAREQLARLEDPQAGYVPAYDIAQVHAALGDADALFEWLARAVAERSRHLDTLGVSPVMAPYRSDPRMAALLEAIGLGEQACR
jgi:DNA-binding winged helix-turn-helix (wHTH) protein/Flp pilus assembly protein TadD